MTALKLVTQLSASVTTITTEENIHLTLLIPESQNVKNCEKLETC